MNPDCKYGLVAETHHILPISQGGNDKEENFIVLCRRCHRLARRHSEFREQEIMLSTWKYYFESLFEAAMQGNEIAQEKIDNAGINDPFRIILTKKSSQVEKDR